MPVNVIEALQKDLEEVCAVQVMPGRAIVSAIGEGMKQQVGEESQKKSKQGLSREKKRNYRDTETTQGLMTILR